MKSKYNNIINKIVNESSSTLYIITSDDTSETFDIYTTREKALSGIKEVYDNGYVGSLTVSEDEIIS